MSNIREDIVVLLISIWGVFGKFMVKHVATQGEIRDVSPVAQDY